MVQENSYRGRYADTGVEYVETLFEEQRERKEVRAKEQEEKAKKINFWDKVVKGGNKLINYRADKLEETQLPAKLRYEQFIKRSIEARRQLNEAQTKNQTDVEYLTAKLTEELKLTASGTFSHYDMEGISPWIREQAREQAEKLAPHWRKWGEEALDLPSQEVFTEQYGKYEAREAPRSIFDIGMRAITGSWKRQTPETIAQNKQRSRDVLHGSSLYTEFEEFGEALKVFDNAGYDTEEFIEKINAKIAAKDVKLKKVGNPSIHTATIPDGFYNRTTVFAVQQLSDGTIEKTELESSKSLSSDQVFNRGELVPLMQQHILSDYQEQFMADLTMTDSSTGLPILHKGLYAAALGNAVNNGGMKGEGITQADILKLWQSSVQGVRLVNPNTGNLEPIFDRDETYPLDIYIVDWANDEIQKDPEKLGHLTLEGFTRRMNEANKTGVVVPTMSTTKGETTREVIGLSAQELIIQQFAGQDGGADKVANATAIIRDYAGPDSEFGKFVNKQIDESPPDEDYVTIGTFDASIFAPESGLTGKYEVTWNKGTESFIYRELTAGQAGPLVTTIYVDPEDARLLDSFGGGEGGVDDETDEVTIEDGQERESVLTDDISTETIDITKEQKFGPEFGGEQTVSTKKKKTFITPDVLTNTVDAIDLSELTAGQLRTLSMMSDSAIEDKLGLTDMSLRESTFMKPRVFGFRDIFTVYIAGRGKDINDLTSVQSNAFLKDFRSRSITPEELPKDFWENFMSELKIQSQGKGGEESTTEATNESSVGYVGKRNEDNKFHGQGTLIRANGTKQVGEWRDGSFIKSGEE